MSDLKENVQALSNKQERIKQALKEEGNSLDEIYEEVKAGRKRIKRLEEDNLFLREGLEQALKRISALEAKIGDKKGE